VLARIDTIRGELSSAIQEVESRRTELLALQAKVAEEERLASATLEVIAKARNAYESSLMTRDAPPLWQLVDLLREPEPMMDRIDSSWASQGETLRGFAMGTPGAGRLGRLLAQALFFAFTLLLARAAGTRAENWRADDPRLEQSAVVFERPISAAVLLTLIATPLFHPRPPAILLHLLGLLLLIPVLRLLPRLIGRGLTPILGVLAAFFVFDQVRDLLDAAPALARLLLLAELLAASVGLGWLLRPSRLAALPPGTHVPQVVSLALRGSFLLLLIGLAANVLGWVALSRLLADGIFTSAYLATIIYGGLRILRAAWRAFLRSRVADRLHMVRRHGVLLAERGVRLLNALAIAAFTVGVFRSFGLAADALAFIENLLSATAAFGTVSISLGDLVSFALIVALTIGLSRLLRFVLDEDVLPRAVQRRGVGHAISATAQYVILGAGFMLALAAAGIDFNRFTLLAGALGVGLGFGLQEIVNNLVSGLILLYERPIQVGDSIEVGTLLGDVRRIGIRSSTVRTWQGAEVIVPNSKLTSDQVVNWTLSDRQRRMELHVGVAYGSEPPVVLDLLHGVAEAHPDVLAHPPPQALFLGFGASSLDFELRCWTARFETFRATQSELATQIWAALDAANIPIPFPQRDLHLKSVEPGATRAILGAAEAGPGGAAGSDPVRIPAAPESPPDR
jgi:small-conductance mechanosensitive channel